MRLKEDSDSWKSSNVKRRMFLAPDTWPRYRSRKNTKRWCKGKVGREHDYVKSAKRSWRGDLECTGCGRITRRFKFVRRLS